MKLAPFSRLAIASASLAIASACLMAAWQTVAPLSAPVVFPFSETYYARSVDAATAGRSAEAIVWADKAIHAAPARAENWVLLAYACEAADRSISPRVVDAMRKSYAVAPLSIDADYFRLSVVFSNWSRFPRDLQQLAFREAKTYGESLYPARTRLEALVPVIQDSQGRFVLGVIIMSAKTRQDEIYRERQSH